MYPICGQPYFVERSSKLKTLPSPPPLEPANKAGFGGFDVNKVHRHSPRGAQAQFEPSCALIGSAPLCKKGRSPCGRFAESELLRCPHRGFQPSANDPCCAGSVRPALVTISNSSIHTDSTRLIGHGRAQQQSMTQSHYE